MGVFEGKIAICFVTRGGEKMKKLIEVKGKSQFEEDIDKKFRLSACGPVTAYVMMNHHFSDSVPYNVNELYSRLGGTRIGLFTWRFIRNMRKLLGQDWDVSKCTIREVIEQLDAGHPVAAKFDKWFTFNWRGKYAFNYHWVPVVGYEVDTDDVTLIIQDNGGKNRPSELRRVSFRLNKSIITFVKMEKLT